MWESYMFLWQPAQEDDPANCWKLIFPVASVVSLCLFIHWVNSNTLRIRIEITMEDNLILITLFILINHMPLKIQQYEIRKGCK